MDEIKGKYFEILIFSVNLYFLLGNNDLSEYTFYQIDCKRPIISFERFPHGCIKEKMTMNWYLTHQLNIKNHSIIMSTWIQQYEDRCYHWLVSFELNIKS